MFPSKDTQSLLGKTEPRRFLPLKDVRNSKNELTSKLKKEENIFAHIFKDHMNESFTERQFRFVYHHV